MRPERRLRSILSGLVLSAAVAALPVWGQGAARAQEYLLHPGDVIEMSITGLPEMSQRSTVQIDGSLSLPEVGDIDAAGRPISEIREVIRAALSSKLLVVYLPTGAEVTRVVSRDQVTAAVAEYRPVFVSGDVSLPGERVFRPGMTARQAIAAAGGLATALPAFPGQDPAKLRADYAEAWYAATAAAARVQRLSRELGEDVTFDRSAWPPAPESGGALDRILEVESHLFDTRAQNYQREGLFLDSQRQQIEDQTAVLQRQLEVEKTVEESTAADLLKATQASEKGLLTQARLQDVRGAALFASTRRLQTEVNLMQLERRRTEVSREVERRAELRRLDLLDELQKARISEGRERARLLAVSEGLRSVGVAPVTASEGAQPPQITIIRDGTELAGPVTFETRIAPGDVVEVRRGPALSSLAQAQPQRTVATQEVPPCTGPRAACRQAAVLPLTALLPRRPATFH